MQSNSFLEHLKFLLIILQFQKLKYSLLGLAKSSEWVEREVSHFMSNDIQLILNPIVYFEMRMEWETSCQNDDKTLRNPSVKLVHRSGVYPDPLVQLKTGLYLMMQPVLCFTEFSSTYLTSNISLNLPPFQIKEGGCSDSLNWCSDSFAVIQLNI